MKKILSQILLILIIMIIGTISGFINSADANSAASLSCGGTANIGDTINVTLNLPANAYAAEATVTIKYADGTSNSSRIVYVSGMTGYGNSTSFSAKVAGAATITASNIIISDANSNPVESNGSTATSLTIIEPKPAENPPAPVQPTQPTQPTKPETPAPPTTPTTNTTPEKPKEPEVKNPTFKEVNETVYATTGCNVRSSCSSSIKTNKIGGLVKGQEVTRTGKADGWSRILYNGKVAYVASNLLTTEKPEEDENVVNNTVNEITNEISENNVVTNEIQAEKTELELLQEDIGVLPEVGNNIAVEIYVIITAMAMAISGILLYYINKKDVK